MANIFGSLVFTPVVKELQQRFGSRRQYERLAAQGTSHQELGPDEREFITKRDSFYMASIGSTGWPYVQHRGGPKGFLKVLNHQTIAFADYRGNKQYISTGNLLTDDRIALILVDYLHQASEDPGSRKDQGERGRGWRASCAGSCSAETY